MKRWILGVVLSAACFAMAMGEDRRWENPIFATREHASEAARELALGLGPDSPPAARLFVGAALEGPGMTHRVVESVLVAHPKSMLGDEVQRHTVERFTGEIPRQRRIITRRLARFGFPQLGGLVFCTLVDSVDAFAHLGKGSSDRMSRVGGVTYYCRFVVLPLSYVGADNLRDLEQSAALNPSMDVDATLRRWQRESYASLVNTFRHELVHVHTNSSIGLPTYSDRALYPTWFHEGTATYLAGDPHSGLSNRYKVYQKTFFYLVQRFGIATLADFYRQVLGGSSVLDALSRVYGIAESQELFDRSRRWHRNKSWAFACLWMCAIGLVAVAFRGVDVPVVGGLSVVAAAALLLAVVTGFPQHLAGLQGSAAVLAARVVLLGCALGLAWNGFRRIRPRHG
jgi:hypothetical protein